MVDDATVESVEVLKEEWKERWKGCEIVMRLCRLIKISRKNLKILTCGHSTKKTKRQQNFDHFYVFL